MEPSSCMTTGAPDGELLSVSPSWNDADSSSSAECSICLDRLSSPRVLQCSHAFCLKCLVQHLAANNTSRTTGSLTCPNCRQVCCIPGGVSALPGPGVAAGLCELCVVGVIVAYCTECQQAMCKACCNVHRQLVATRSHAVVTPTLHQASSNTASSLTNSSGLTPSGLAVGLQFPDSTALLRLPPERQRVVDNQISKYAAAMGQIDRDRTDLLGSVDRAEQDIGRTVTELKAKIDDQQTQLHDDLTLKKSSGLKQLQQRQHDLQLNVDSLLAAAASGRYCDVLQQVQTCPPSNSQLLVFIPTEQPRLGVRRANMLGTIETIGDTSTTQRPVEASRHKRKVESRSSESPQPRNYSNKLFVIGGSVRVCGLCVVDNKLYVCRQGCTKLDVFDVTRATSAKHLTCITGLVDPVDMTHCDELASLFVCSTTDQSLHRVMPAGRGGTVARWPLSDKPSTVSCRHQQLVVLFNESPPASVRVFSAVDQLELLHVCLPASLARLHCVLQCQQNFLISTDTAIVTVNWEGYVTGSTQLRCANTRLAPTDIILEDDGEGGDETGKNGELLMADERSGFVVRVGTSLQTVTTLLGSAASYAAAGNTHRPAAAAAVSDIAVLERPCRLCLDRTRGRLLVAVDDGSVHVFDNTCTIM